MMCLQFSSPMILLIFIWKERWLYYISMYICMYMCKYTIYVFVFCLVCKTLISLQVTGNGNVKLSVGFAAFDVMSCYSKVQII